MRKAIKKKGKQIKAYCLGKNKEKINEFEKQGLLKKIDKEHFEVFSHETKNGKGQIAKVGDYIKFDSSGRIYPNDKEYFEKNHKHIKGDIFEQIPGEVSFWTADEERCPEIDYLIKKKGLMIDINSVDKYFTAPLWGSMLSAGKKDVIVFYSIDKKNGEITEVDFNFVEKDEFNNTYIILG